MRQGGRVELDELHVHQRCPSPVGHAHAVPGVDDGVGAREVNAAAAAGRQYDGLGLNGVQTALQEVPGDDAPAAAVLDDERRDIPLVVDVHLALRERLVHGVLQRAVGAVGGV